MIYFFFLLNSSLHNYADDNTITATSNSIKNLVDILENESKIALVWLQNNKMIANPEKFHAIILRRGKFLTNHENVVFKIGDQTIKSEESVKLLGITIDNQLNFNKHISSICKKTSAQLNALYRLKNFISFKAKKALAESFVFSNFNYCSLVWNFSSAESLNKINMIHKRTLRFVQDDFESSYEDLLLKSMKPSMNVLRLRQLCIEIFKSINNISPSYMKQIFILKESNRSVRSQYFQNLEIDTKQTVKFGSKSLSYLGPKIWNNLPLHIKNSANVNVFKKVIKFWDGEKCLCKSCRN